MNIEKLGVHITGVPLLEGIEVSASGITPYGGAEFTRAEVIEMRDALNAALDAHAEMIGVGLFMPGQQLDGTEDLPVGTVVRDSDPQGSDEWTLRSDYWETSYGDIARTLRYIVQRYGPVTIVSLP